VEKLLHCIFIGWIGPERDNTTCDRAARVDEIANGKIEANAVRYEQNLIAK